MSIDYNSYNQFAMALVKKISDRSKGIDEDCDRLAGIRPQDHILAGFLTPVQNEAIQNEIENNAEEAEDWPQDSAYEQTAIGLEWIAPLEALQASNTVEVDVKFNIFVRRMPTYKEQMEKNSWNAEPYRRDREQEPSEERVARLVPIWTREALPSYHISINLGELRDSRKISKSLEGQIAESEDSIDFNRLYPSRRDIEVAESILKTEELFENWIGSFSQEKMPVAWKPIVDIRIKPMPLDPEKVRIALRVVNNTSEVSARLLDFVDPNLYAVELTAKLPRQVHCNTLFKELPDSFRYNRDMPGVGINAHVDAHHHDDHIVLKIDSVPIKVIDRLEPRAVENATPTFSELAENPVPLLNSILKEMKDYDGSVWLQKLSRLSGQERSEAEQARGDFKKEIGRFERGVKLLAGEDDRYKSARRAFSLMNRAMEKSAEGNYDRWRLFQIAFIVSQLPALAGREYPELVEEGDDEVDILWFAAGGGKTEAFLGLIIWQAFFDRLRDKKLGVTALVRFPLRLLVYQQLQRVGKAMAAAEEIRHQEGIAGARFSMGYFVGSTLTPNSIDPRHHTTYCNHGPDPRFQVFFNCPFCDSEVRLVYNEELRLVEHRCTDQQCSGGRERLPIYIVDRDVYRYLPTVIVSTVDKLAQMGQNQRFANIFGGFDMVCHKHGVSFKDVNKRDGCEASESFGRGEKSNSCEGVKVDYGPFHDPAPALLIQDELHLLSEELGTFNAHYETAAIELMKSLGHKPWKVIGATATIKEFNNHAFHLYLRKSRQFPGPGPEAYESFYYRQDSERIGRIFMGVLGVGRKHTPAVTKLLSLTYTEIQKARELWQADPEEAGRVYKTGLLEQKDFQELIFYYELALTYVLTRKGSDQVSEAIESRVKGELDETLPAHGELIVDTFNGGADPAEMKQTIENLSTANSDGSPAERTRGIVTTNIIGHGVDVDRFNIIVFAGFTRLVAEYIQSSARVGRKYPGISILVATPQSERDRSIFDRFVKFHEYLDRLVDPSAINRWPEPAIQQTIGGVLSAYLMGYAARNIGKPLALDINVMERYGQSGSEALNEEEVIRWIMQAYGADVAPSPEQYESKVSTIARNTYRLIDKTRRPGRPMPINMLLAAMRSLRDVDEPASVQMENEQENNILKGLING